ncbi:hypothetical protein cand_013640 [Cryptosporidium andersoni]|uniref:Zinc finger PHD-type domain-containing protein n=1 Tax=Cryptosporidium andersoni TaxID=117008 RepID=A0A1J4MUI5_9CRYT|nr:hypothetical protein cand_013640 [Cryptosporidium andersoni]
MENFVSEVRSTKSTKISELQANNPQLQNRKMVSEKRRVTRSMRKQIIDNEVLNLTTDILNTTPSGKNIHNDEYLSSTNMKKKKKVTKINVKNKKGNIVSNKTLNILNKDNMNSKSISQEIDNEITSVTLINENSQSTKVIGSSRLAKISWSKFDSYFRLIPIGKNKEKIMNTLPISNVQRKVALTEVSYVEELLRSEFPWGPIGESHPYLTLKKLSLPPLYLPNCNVEYILDLISRYIIKGRSNNVKSNSEILKPWIVLFKLPHSISMVILDSKLPIGQFKQIESENSIKLESSLNTLNVNSSEKLLEFDSNKNITELYSNWDLHCFVELSYYQYYYICKFLENVYYNYDSIHKRILFSMVRNIEQYPRYINVNDIIKKRSEEFQTIVSSYLGYPIDLNYFFTYPEVPKSDMINVDKIKQEVKFNVFDNLSSIDSTDLLVDNIWDSYHTYDPIYWWIDFVLSQKITETFNGCKYIGNPNNKIAIRPDYQTLAEIPCCIYLGGLWWIDPTNPLKLYSNKDEFLCDPSDIDDNKKGESVPYCNLLHPYTMRIFELDEDFNFVQANLERFVPIYSEIVETLGTMKYNIEEQISRENDKSIPIANIPTLCTNIIQRYKVVNSWSKLRNQICLGYKDLEVKNILSNTIVQSNTKVDTKEDKKDITNPTSIKVSNIEDKPNLTSTELTNVCCICFGAQTDTICPFVECVRCGIVVHAPCYSINIPSHELLDFYGWLCDRCELEKKSLGTQYLINFTAGNIKCSLCSHRGGAFKRTTNPGEWVHIVCVIWLLPLVTCEDWLNLDLWNIWRINRRPKQDQYIEELLQTLKVANYTCNVEDQLNTINKDEMTNNFKYNSNRCTFCQNEATASLIKCSFSCCKVFYHPICAWLNGIYVYIDEEPNYNSGSSLLEYLYNKENLLDTCMRMINIHSYCIEHSQYLKPERDITHQSNLRKRRYVNRDLFPDLYSSKYSQKISRKSQGTVQRSRNRPLTRSNSWESTIPLETSTNNINDGTCNKSEYYATALIPDKYNPNICSVCLKSNIIDCGNATSNSNEYLSYTICMSKDEILDLGLIRCKCCGITVHWTCYGLNLLPKSFVCQICKIGLRSENIPCLLCPRRGGALKIAQISTYKENINSFEECKRSFVHITCALYTPGVYPIDNEIFTGVSNYQGMVSLVKLQRNATIKNKSYFVRKFSYSEGVVQQFPFKILTQNIMNETSQIDIPAIFCCICKSCFGVIITCSYAGCNRMAHALCLNLHGCLVETIADVSNISSKSYGNLDIPNNSSGVLYIPPGSPPPLVNNEQVIFKSGETSQHNLQYSALTEFSQRVYCPEHGLNLARLNPGGKLLLSVHSSLSIALDIIEKLQKCEKIKRSLYHGQIEILSKGFPLISPDMTQSIDILQAYWNHFSNKNLFQSVKIKDGVISKFKDLGKYNPEKIQTKSYKKYIPVGTSKRTRSSGEVISVPSLEDAIKEARKQRQIYKQELAAAGIVIRKRLPPNRTPAIPFTRLNEEQLREAAINCLNSIGRNHTKIGTEKSLEIPYNSQFTSEISKISNISPSNTYETSNINKSIENNSINIYHSHNKSDKCTTNNELTIEQSQLIESTQDISQIDNQIYTAQNLQSNVYSTNVQVSRPFCLRQHRHDCFRRRIAEFILNPPVVMDHRKKMIRSFTRQLRQYGVTAEEMLVSDVALPVIKSKPNMALNEISKPIININQQTIQNNIDHEQITDNLPITDITNQCLINR